MEITRELAIKDHAAGIAEQDREIYSLTREGKRIVECLRTIENYLGK